MIFLMNMHGLAPPLAQPPPHNNLVSFFNLFSTSPPSRSSLFHLQIQPKSWIPICRHSSAAATLSSLSLFSPFPSSTPSLRDSKKKRRRGFLTLLRASRRESPYDVLGVSPSATSDEIKRAYRKLALQYHPDVNKEANAQEKFMRIKHAYNTLLNSESRRKYDYGKQGSDFSYSSSQRSTTTQDEEEFYGFEDFFKDLQEEFRNWEATASSQGKPKSLWEELAEIGEEFVEFLEKELNISDSELETDDNNEGSEKGSTFKSSRAQNTKSGYQNISKGSSIEDNIDEIEATLAQLKRELGL